MWAQYALYLSHLFYIEMTTVDMGTTFPTSSCYHCTRPQSITLTLCFESWVFFSFHTQNACQQPSLMETPPCLTTAWQCFLSSLRYILTTSTVLNTCQVFLKSPQVQTAMTEQLLSLLLSDWSMGYHLGTY